jgi:hypothetical protein
MMRPTLLCVFIFAALGYACDAENKASSSDDDWGEEEGDWDGSEEPIDPFDSDGDAEGDDGGDDADADEADGDEYEGDVPGECSDGADNDRDGLYDCDDPDCAGSPDCADDDDEGADGGGDSTGGDTPPDDGGDTPPDDGGDPPPDDGGDPPPDDGGDTPPDDGGEVGGGEVGGGGPDGGDPTGGDPTGGDPTGGDPTGGDPTGGEVGGGDGGGITACDSGADCELDDCISGAIGCACHDAIGECVPTCESADDCPEGEDLICTSGFCEPAGGGVDVSPPDGF